MSRIGPELPEFSVVVVVVKACHSSRGRVAECSESITDRNSLIHMAEGPKATLTTLQPASSPAMKLSRLLLASALLSGPLAAVPIGAHADSWKDESGSGYDHKHHGGNYKEEYWDGACKVERKWKGNGEYKEKSKCKGGYVTQPPAVIYQPVPAVVISPQVVIGQ